MSDKSGRRGLTNDERGLWDHVTKPIKPLRNRPAAKANEPIAGTELPAKVRRQSPAAPLVSPAKPVPLQPPPLAPLGRREKAKVARGHVAIDRKLDLHGHTQTQAHAALLRFLQRGSEDGARLVLVITGKSGVLRQEVPRWLTLPEFRALVIAVEPAAIRHGGEGALYVRLRRSR